MVKAFGTAGVRGVFNRTQTPEQVCRLVETIAFTLGRGKYGVGWDGRKASALLARTVTSAVNAVGSDAHTFGAIPTPVVAFSTKSRACAAGFSVTASHNPARFSGVKIFNTKGMELPASDEERIERALAVDVTKSSGVFGRLVSDEEAVDDYVQALVARYEKAREPLRIAVDCANGPGGIVTPQVLKLLGHHVVSVNAQVSWRFSARPPEPTASNLVDFSRIVSELGVDVAFAHDGDADRLVMLDALGRVVSDSIVTILALQGLNTSNGVTVISENTSAAVAEEAEKLGFRVARSRVGKTFATLEAEDGVFAAEPSKVVDPRWGLWEDGINAAAMISGLIADDRGVLSRVTEGVQWKYKQVNFDTAVEMGVLTEKAKETFRRFKIQEERTLDGLKLAFADGSWVMFRPSGTEPKTRLYCESKNQQLLDILVQLGTQCIQSSKQRDEFE